MIKDISYEFRQLSSIPQRNHSFDGLAGIKSLILILYIWLYALEVKHLVEILYVLGYSYVRMIGYTPVKSF